jgi:hypothetical protein
MTGLPFSSTALYKSRLFDFLVTPFSSPSLGNVIFYSTADSIGLVQEEFSVAERRFGILINGHDDCLDMLSASLRAQLTAEPRPGL